MRDGDDNEHRFSLTWEMFLLIKLYYKSGVIDQDDNGCISFDEFVWLMQQGKILKSRENIVQETELGEKLKKCLLKFKISPPYPNSIMQNFLKWLQKRQNISTNTTKKVLIPPYRLATHNGCMLLGSMMTIEGDARRRYRGRDPRCVPSFRQSGLRLHLCGGSEGCPHSPWGETLTGGVWGLSLTNYWAFSVKEKVFN